VGIPVTTPPTAAPRAGGDRDGYKTDEPVPSIDERLACSPVMSCRSILLIFLVVAVTACRPKSTAPSPSPEPPADPPPATADASSDADASPVARSTAAKPRTLVVASERGIREVGYDGAVVRVLTSTPARRPRFVSGGREVLFYARSAGEIRRLSLETGGERRVAVLPRAFKVCGHMPDYPPGHVFSQGDLDVQDDGGFVVDAGGGSACMALMDRNANMLNVRIELRIDLSSGAVQHRVVIGGDCARAPPAWRNCTAASEPATRATPFPVATLDAGVDLTEETIAPGGRWSVVSMLGDMADYIYQWLFLLDRERRRIFPIVAGPFPAPLALGALGGADGGLGTAIAVGETTVRWLGDHALLVGDLLVVPGQAGVNVGGDVAR
jgi:hypothetical protein